MNIGLVDEGSIVVRERIDRSARRRVTPVEVLLPRTFRWLARLPREARPMELSRLFPRIANLLAAHWAEPDATHVYLDDLLVDRRGGRQGFPTIVNAELLEFKMLYEIFDCGPIKRHDGIKKKNIDHLKALDGMIFASGRKSHDHFVINITIVIMDVGVGMM